MPLAILAVFGLSIAALLITSGFLPLPLVFFGAAALSYFVDVRLVGNNPSRWFLRLGLILFIFLLNPDQARDSDWAIGTARLRNLFAQYYAVEVALQFFRVHPRTETASGDSIRPRLIALTLSGMIFLSASNTFDERWIRVLTPVWIVLSVLGLQSLRPRLNSGALATGFRVAAVLAAIVAGLGGYVAVYGQRGQLNEISARFIRIRPPYEVSGMAQNPRLGETFDLRGSAERVLRIEKFNGDAHWRGIAFDEYEDNGRWGPSFVQRSYKPVTDLLLNPPQVFRRTDTREMTVSRLTGNNPILYAPLGLASLSVGDDEANTEVALDAGGPFRIRATPPLIYLTTLTQEEQYQGILATPITREYRARCLQLPDGFDARVGELAQRIVSEERARTAAQKAEAIAAHLITSHQYSLRYKPTTPDPIVGFLVDSPPAAAHCEYFAAGAALMLRTVGVPTRYVTGYLAHEGESPNTVIVRQRDAHAWCEAYLDGIGWVTVDATPGTGRPDKNPEKVESWRRAQEWLQDRWAQITGFLGDLTGNQGRPVVLGVLACLIGAGMLGYLRAMRRNRPRVGWQYQPAPPSVAALQARFDQALKRQGLSTPPAASYGQYLAMQGSSPLVETARQWVRVYEAARFGSPSVEMLGQLEALTRAVEESAKAALSPSPPTRLEKE